MHRSAPTRRSSNPSDPLGVKMMSTRPTSVAPWAANAARICSGSKVPPELVLARPSLATAIHRLEAAEVRHLGQSLLRRETANSVHVVEHVGTRHRLDHKRRVERKTRRREEPIARGSGRRRLAQPNARHHRLARASALGEGALADTCPLTGGAKELSGRLSHLELVPISYRASIGHLTPSSPATADRARPESLRCSDIAHHD